MASPSERARNDSGEKKRHREIHGVRQWPHQKRTKEHPRIGILVVGLEAPSFGDMSLAAGPRTGGE
jgi:hypothetical protein